jgi:hypothetical integral membrane protein (TIGR02206 family)
MLSGTAHLLILITVVSVSSTLSFAVRNNTAWRQVTRLWLAAFLTVNELIWYGYRLTQEGFRFPEALPLQLCDFTLWLTVLAVLTLRPPICELAYFGGLGGSSMALLMPDLWAPFPAYPTIYFFLSHGFVVITILTLTVGGSQSSLLVTLVSKLTMRTAGLTRSSSANTSPQT